MVSEDQVHNGLAVCKSELKHRSLGVESDDSWVEFSASGGGSNISTGVDSSGSWGKSSLKSCSFPLGMSVWECRWSEWRQIVWPSSSSTVKDTGPLTSFKIPGNQRGPFPKFSAYTLSPALKSHSLACWSWLSSVCLGFSELSFLLVAVVNPDVNAIFSPSPILLEILLL